VPHCNAWAIAADGGVVLFDTGYAGEEGTKRLEFAMAQVGFDLADVKLLVCTHAHSDHYGLAGPIVDAAGCELWMHPAWEHARAMAEDPDAALDRRIEVARQSGVPQAGLELYEETRRGQGTGIARVTEPDRDLLPGVEIETDLGTWQVLETPGHAPSHVCLHQPESGLLISGDHLLGRISLFFDYGHTPDPVAEFLGGLDEVARLEKTSLCLAGHGRPFRDVRLKIEKNRDEVAEQRGRVRGAVGVEPVTAYEVIPALIGEEAMRSGMAAWGLQLALAYLDNLTLAGEIVRDDDGDHHRWRAVRNVANG
jgi:glyoxylase-like metal-dependent hydrolase (beta-lactamase superfamily II)